MQKREMCWLSTRIDDSVRVIKKTAQLIIANYNLRVDEGWRCTLRLKVDEKISRNSKGHEQHYLVEEGVKLSKIFFK